MTDENLTAEEKRNLELVKEWAEAWGAGSTARMVDEIYADTTEVFLPLSKIYFAKRGMSKENWRAVELASEKLYGNRKMNLVTTIARGDTVAVEASTTTTRKDGKTGQGWFAAFLKFDEDGRIVSDHTFMRTAGERRDPEQATNPDVKKALEAVHRAIIQP